MLDDAGVVEGTAKGMETPGASGRKALTRELELLGAGSMVMVGSYLYPYLKGLVDSVAPGCLFRRLTGLPCLLCGMTRSFAATSHGRWEEAFRMHLLGPPLFMLVAAATVLLALERASSRRFLPRPGKASLKRTGWALLFLLVAAWATRLILYGVNV